LALTRLDDAKVPLINRRYRVNDLANEGEALIKRLEGRRLQIAAAFWDFLEALDRRRLVIVFSSLVNRDGPLSAYMRIQEVLADMQAKELSLSGISVLGLNDHEFRELRPQVERSVQVSNRTHRPWPKSLNPSRLEYAHTYRWAA
jgi:hypothetical protein